MRDVKSTNLAGVARGGAIAGVIHFLVTGIANGVVLRAPLQTWMQSTGDMLRPPAQPIPMALWAIMSLTYGFVGVWIYAGIAPRYGAGPKTALLAGTSLWVISKFAVALDLTALGIMPAQIVAGQTIVGFVAILLGVLVGARFYRD
jgi:hypothetical protein